MALIQDGDMISIDIPARKLELDVAEDELAKRRPKLAAAQTQVYQRGPGPLRGGRHQRRQRRGHARPPFEASKSDNNEKCSSKKPEQTP